MFLVMGTGWKVHELPGDERRLWSEGPRSTLLIGVAPGKPLTLRLHATGIGFNPGEARAVAVHFGRLEAPGFDLPDGIETEVVLQVPAEATRDGMLRVAFDVIRPVDPAATRQPSPGKAGGDPAWRDEG